MLTNAPEVILSTDFHRRLIAGSVLPQIARLHQRSPFSLPSSVAHMDLQAMRFGWLTCSAAPCHPCWWIKYRSLKVGFLPVPNSNSSASVANLYAPATELSRGSVMFPEPYSLNSELLS